MATFGEHLRRLRGNRPQREIAEQLKIPITTLSTLENQESVPRGAVLKRLADFYGVSLTYFYAPVRSEPRPSDSARRWLQAVRRTVVDEVAIATHAPPEFPEEVKKRFAELIRKRKHAEATGRK